MDNSYKLAAEIAPLTFYEQDLDLRYLWMHQGQVEKPGFDVKGRTSEDLFGAEEAAKLNAFKRKVLQTGQTARDIFPLVYKGEERSFDLIVAPRKNEEGEVVGVIGVANDITDRLLAWQKVVESENLYRLLSECTSDFIWLCAEDGTLLFASPSCERMTHWKISEVVGEDLRKFMQIGRGTDEAFIQAFNRACKGERQKALSHCISRRDGSTLWVETVLTPVLDQDGRTFKVLGSTRDVSERALWNEVHTARTKFFKDAQRGRFQQAMEDLLSFLEARTGNCCAVFAKHPDSEEMAMIACGGLSKSVKKLLLASLREEPFAVRERTLKDNERTFAHASDFPRRQANCLCKAGIHSMWAEPICTLDSSGAVGVLEIFSASEGPPAEEHLQFFAGVADFLSLALHRKWTEDRLRLHAKILEHVPDSVIMADLNGIIRSWSKSSERIYGYTAEEAIGQPISLLHPEEKEHFYPELLQRVVKEEPIRFEKQRKRKSGEQFYGRSAVSALRDSDGDLVGIIGSTTDVTQEREVAEKLAETNTRLEVAALEAKELAEKAQAASVAKSQFLANMSHEIRTPMNGVIGMAELLSFTNLDEEQRRYTEAIQKSGDAMIAVVNQILDFSAIESGRMQLHLAPFSPRKLVSDVALMLEAMASAKNLSLRCTTSDDIPELIRGDAERIRQVLVNLVGNAIKFTDSGSVELSVTVNKAFSQHCSLRFRVTDTGSGIPENCLKTIFASFTQADGSSTRRHGGTGLGLTISRELCMMMGGNLEVASTVGVGSVFHADLPFRIVGGAALAA